LEPTTPSESLPHSLSDLTHVHSTQLSQPFGQPSQSLQTRLTDQPTATVSALSQLPVITSHVQISLVIRLDLPGWQEDRPWHQYQDTRALVGSTPRQRLSSPYSPLPPSTSCEKNSPEPLARHLVSPSELTQLTDLLALFTGVASTTPAELCTWPTPITKPSSGTEIEASRLPTTAAGTQRLRHALGDPAAPSTHIPAVSAVTALLPKSPGYGLNCNKVLSPQRDKDKDVMETDDINTVCCLGQPTAVLSSPRGGQGWAGDGQCHEGGLLTSGTTKKKRRSGSAKHSGGNAGGNNQVSRHRSHLTYLSKQ